MKLPLCALLLTSLAACDLAEGEPASPPVAQRDTLGGIEHVTYPHGVTGTAADAWQVASQPAVEIGSVGGDGPDLFGQIAGVVVGGDGRIYVADGQANEVRAFSPAGEFVASFGRAGEGPGEFRDIGGLGRGPDGGIAVLDGMLGRVSLFAAEGRVRRSFRLERPYMIVGRGVPVQFDAEGGFYDVVPLSRPGSVDSTGLVRYGAGGAVKDTLLFHTHEPRQLMVLKNGLPSVSVSIPFAPSPSGALDSQGGLYTTSGDEYRVVLRNAAGDTLRILRREIPSVPVDAAVRDSLRKVIVERYVAIAGSEPRERFDIPTEMPAILDLRVDPHDHLWVRRPLPDPDEMAWDVFDPEGVFLGELQLPAMHLIHVAEDGIAGVVYDELGVETVRVHPLSRGESSGAHLADPGI